MNLTSRLLPRLLPGILPRLVLILVPLFAASSCSADTHSGYLKSDEIDDLEADYGLIDENGWLERSFAGNTTYIIEGEGDNISIQGTTDGTASVLYRQHTIDLTRQPYVSWRWKISNTYGDIDEQSREGDDYPARFYVVLQTGLLPWQTLAVNYVWSSSGQVGDTWDSAYTPKSKMIALQAGTDRVGEWVTEKRNMVEDFKRLFDIDASQLDGYAFMIDGDDTGSSGMSWFESLRFSHR